MQICQRSLGYSCSSECENSFRSWIQGFGTQNYHYNYRLQYIHISKVKYILQACIKHLCPRFREESCAWLINSKGKYCVFYVHTSLIVLYCTITGMNQHSSCQVALKKSTISKEHMTRQHKSSRIRCKAAVVTNYSVCLWTADGATLWPHCGLNKAHTSELWDELQEKSDLKALHSEHCHVIGHFKVDVLDLKYTHDV